MTFEDELCDKKVWVQEDADEQEEEEEEEECDDDDFNVREREFAMEPLNLEGYDDFDEEDSDSECCAEYNDADG